jgi:hypothetical protein
LQFQSSICCFLWEGDQKAALQVSIPEQSQVQDTKILTDKKRTSDSTDYWKYSSVTKERHSYSISEMGREMYWHATLRNSDPRLIVSDGPIFSLQLGQETVIVLADGYAVKAVLDKRSSNTSDRPKLYMQDIWEGSRIIMRGWVNPPISSWRHFGGLCWLVEMKIRRPVENRTQNLPHLPQSEYCSEVRSIPVAWN